MAKKRNEKQIPYGAFITEKWANCLGENVTDKALYAVSIIFQIAALILELLPFGAVLVFATSPTEIVTHTYSYFNLALVGMQILLLCLQASYPFLLSYWELLFYVDMIEQKNVKVPFSYVV